MTNMRYAAGLVFVYLNIKPLIICTSRESCQGGGGGGDDEKEVVGHRDQEDV